MKGSWIHYIRGFVTVKLASGEADKFLAETISKVELWDLSYGKDGKLRFRVSVPDFFRLRPMVRRAGGRTRILERHGIPFRMARLSRRKTFAAGMLGFVAALFALSTLIWDVQVEGNDRIPSEQILKAARAEGVYPMQWSPRMKDTSELASRLALRIPGVSWVGVEKRGTKIQITVVEAAKPEDRKLESPKDIVAKTDAVVTRIVAENGRPKVQRNDRVRKGDVLISGIVGEGDRTKAVVSKGEVRGLVWHEYKIASPLTVKSKGFTGSSNERGYLVIGNRALQVSGYGQEPFERSEVLGEIKRLRLGKWTLPFGQMNEVEKEVAYTETKLTEDEAKRAGLEQARAELLAACGPGAVIKGEKLLHEHTENGKVMINVLFEVEQSIAMDRPIVQTSPNETDRTESGTEATNRD